MDHSSTTQIWYLRDEAVSVAAEDAFAHIDLARELKVKIEQLPPPLTIALSGPHGTGKSSIGALLEKEFEADPRYEFVRIEAWRHEGESRRKAFLHDVLADLGERFARDAVRKAELERLKHSLYATRAHQSAVLDLSGAKESLKVVVREVNTSAVKAGVVSAVAVAVLLLAWYFYTVSTVPGVAASALVATLPSVLAVPFMAGAIGYLGSTLRQIVSKVLEPAKITITSNPPSSAEQYEHIFRDALRVALGNGGTSKTMVLFVDELDRLEPGEIIEALKAIRTFRDVKPCVFVVALDEDVVKRAIRDAGGGAGLIEKPEEAEEFLNKFFKLRRHVPLLVPGDMRDFAQVAIGDPDRRRVTAGIAGLPKELLDDTLDALIHRRVETPRHAIRLINAFNGDYHLALAREGGLLSQTALTGNPPFLAVMTCLREDYPTFHATLSRNHDLLFALDMLLDEQPADAVEKRYPGYTALCAEYFEPVAEARSDGHKVPDVSSPKPSCRDLVLYVRETAKFRSSSIYPYLYLRETKPARFFGSAVYEEIAAEFESGFAAALRKRAKDGGEPVAGALAEIAGTCLNDSRGISLENVLMSSCDIFGEFDEARQASLADKIAMRYSQNRAWIAGTKPEPLVDVLSRAPATPHRQTCVNVLASQASTEHPDRSCEILTAAVRHSELIETDEAAAALRAFAAALPTAAPLSDLHPLIRLLRDSAGNSNVVERLFGRQFLPAIAIATASGKDSELPAGFSDDIQDLWDALGVRAADQWPGEYLSASVSLLDAPNWSLFETALSALMSHVSRLDPVTARNALQALLKDANRPDASLPDLQESAHELLLALAAMPDAGAFDGKEAAEAVNGYLFQQISSESEEERVRARLCAVRLAGLVKQGYLAPLCSQLASFVTENLPSERASGALRGLIPIAGAVPGTELAAFVEAVTLPLRQAASSESAAFGADAMSQMLSQAAPKKIADAASAHLPALVNLINTRQAPPVLAHVGRALDSAGARLGEHIPAYAQSLVAYCGSNDPAYIHFALVRMQAAADAGLLGDDVQPLLSRAIIETWPYMTAAGSRELAAGLLARWGLNIPEALREAYWDQQVAFLGEAPIPAWDNLSREWALLDNARRAKAVVQAMPAAGLRDRVTLDLASPDRALGPKDAGALLVSVSSAMEPSEFRTVADAVTKHLDAQGTTELAVLLFDHLAALPSPISRPELAAVADGLGSQVPEAGVLFYQQLLRGDEAYRAFALEHLPRLFEAKAANPDRLALAAAALGDALAFGSADLTRQNLRVARAIGVVGTAPYKERLKECATTLRESGTNADRELLKEFRAAQRP